MTDAKPTASGQPGFVRGNERLDQLLADPQLAADVAAAHADAEEMDRVYAMNLAMIRKAAQMTQVEVARKLGVGQGVVSRLEHRDDMLLSTLYDYLMATGADGAGIVVIVHGHRIELDLSRLRNPPEQQSALAHPPQRRPDRNAQLSQSPVPPSSSIRSGERPVSTAMAEVSEPASTFIDSIIPRRTSSHRCSRYAFAASATKSFLVMPRKRAA